MNSVFRKLIPITRHEKFALVSSTSGLLGAVSGGSYVVCEELQHRSSANWPEAVGITALATFVGGCVGVVAPSAFVVGCVFGVPAAIGGSACYLWKTKGTQS